ncbi:helix-turn-helix domain-containing protein [Streptomyces sp. NBC_01614]|uniref:Helix-turn-helix domain-containing protein n=1 Tax=Streptomyces sp. NBC_00180 TaxID=2903632 RepID=A0AAU1HZH7_9ACTN
MLITASLSRQSAAQALELRSKTVPACAVGRRNSQVAEGIGVSREAVRKWRARFAADRLEGLVDKSRSGAPAEDHR